MNSIPRELSRGGEDERLDMMPAPNWLAVTPKRFWGHLLTEPKPRAGSVRGALSPRVAWLGVVAGLLKSMPGLSIVFNVPTVLIPVVINELEQGAAT